MISNSESVVNAFNSAQKEFQDRVESKRFEHLGNENFMKGLIIKDMKRKRESLDVGKKGADLWKNLKQKMKEVQVLNEKDPQVLAQISEDRLRKDY